MILANPKRADIQAQAFSDMRLKRQWEERVAKEMRVEFQRIGKDYEAVYAHTGHAVNLETYHKDIAHALSASYRKVSGAFKTNMRDSLSPTLNSRLKGPLVAAEVDHTLKEYFDARATKQARYIIETTQRQMNQALYVAHVDTITDGTVNQADVAAYMGRWFRDIAPGRATTIGITEVTNSAEMAKYTEAKVLKKALAGKHLSVLLGRKARVTFASDAPSHNKIWVAHLDERTRAAHADADFQSVEWGEAFLVGGEQLQYPGDESMGASLENIINCRCTAVYYANGEVWMGEEPDL